MARRKNTRQRYKKQTIHISTEGARTEKDYLKILDNLFPLETYNIRVYSKNKNKSDPLNVLKYHKEQIIASGPKQTYMKGDIEVIIVDREEKNNRKNEHFKKLQAWQKEKAANRILIVNSTCFEYWLLCHFTDNPKCSTTREILDALKKIWPNYDKTLNKNDINRDQVLMASSRTKKLASLDQMIESEICGSNMHELIDLLIKIENQEK